MDDKSAIEGRTLVTIDDDSGFALPTPVAQALSLGEGDAVVFVVPRRGEAKRRRATEADRGRPAARIGDGKVVLPKYVADQLMVEQGDNLTIELLKDGAVFLSKRANDWDDWGLDPTWLPRRTADDAIDPFKGAW